MHKSVIEFSKVWAHKCFCLLGMNRFYAVRNSKWLEIWQKLLTGPAMEDIGLYKRVGLSIENQFFAF